MDNQNNPNTSNNLNYPPVPAAAAPPDQPTSMFPPLPQTPSAPDTGLNPAPAWPAPTQPSPTVSVSNLWEPPAAAPVSPQPTTAWVPPVEPIPVPPPTPAAPIPSADTTPADIWNPPAQQPVPTLPPIDTTPPANTWSLPAQDQTAAWTPPIQTPSPQVPISPTLPDTFTPPPNIPLPSDTESNHPNQPSLDNPWGSPSQPPPIDGSPQPAIQPSWMNIPQNPAPNQSTNGSPPLPSEAAPTDLSHLITNNDLGQETPAQSTPETLIVPSANLTPEVPTLAAGNHKGIPAWLIGLGIGLLILVAGTSVYFILGIGQPDKGTTSLPATTAPKTAEVKPPPIATPAAKPSEQPATGSANFGELGGNTQPQQATNSSVIETLRQRSQQGK